MKIKIVNDKIIGGTPGTVVFDMNTGKYKGCTHWISGIRELSLKEDKYTKTKTEKEFKLTEENKMDKAVLVEINYRHEFEEDFNEFWYVDIKPFLPEKFIIIDEIYVPVEFRNKGFMTKALKEFCEHYAGLDTLVILRSSVLTREYDEPKNIEEYNVILDRLDKFFTARGFENFNKYSKSYEFSELYIYTDCELGKKVFNDIKNYYVTKLED